MAEEKSEVKSASLEDRFKAEVLVHGLSEKSAEILAKRASEVYTQIEGEVRATEDEKCAIALKLACDDKACAIDPLKTTEMEKEMGVTVYKKKPKMKKMIQARSITGIKQISDPRQRVDAQVSMLSNNGYVPENKIAEIVDGANALLNKYREKRPFHRTPYLMSAVAVYAACLQQGLDIKQPAFRECLNIGPVSLRTGYTDLVDTLRIVLKLGDTERIYRRLLKERRIDELRSLCESTEIKPYFAMATLQHTYLELLKEGKIEDFKTLQEITKTEPSEWIMQEVYEFLLGSADVRSVAVVKDATRVDPNNKIVQKTYKDLIASGAIEVAKELNQVTCQGPLEKTVHEAYELALRAGKYGFDSAIEFTRIKLPDEAIRKAFRRYCRRGEIDNIEKLATLTGDDFYTRAADLIKEARARDEKIV